MTADPAEAAAARTPFRPIGDIRPFLTIISARPIDDADDLDITDQVAAALIVKGWTPPTNTDTHCARRPIPPTEHYFLPHTHTCLHCGSHEKASTP